MNEGSLGANAFYLSTQNEATPDKESLERPGFRVNMSLSKVYWKGHLLDPFSQLSSENSGL